MCNRLWKNVILALCVLALVLQPLVSFATWQTPDYTAVFTTKLSFIQYVSNTSFLMTDVILDLNDNTNTSFQNAVTLIANAFNKNKWDIVYILSGSDLYGFDMSTSYFGASDAQILKRSGVSETYYSMEVGVDLSPESGSINRTTFNKSNGNLYLDFSNSFTVQFFNDNSEYYNLQYNYLGSGSGGDASSSNWTSQSVQAMMGFLQMNFPFWFVDVNNTLQNYNPTWIGVGQALTYDYLCKTNKNSSTVTVTLQNGTSVTLDNYLYGEPDYSSSLSTIQSTLNTISSRANTTNTRLNTLNTSINNQMNAVNNKLNAAFPSNQAAINDFIAEDLMDDTNGNGLTINRIAQSKSDLDDGINTFKLDTSGSQYSNPFSALGDADWSFWSQTTLNNLGSGYSYSFGEGSLMSEDDIFTENQNDLLNLLGW